MYCMIRYEGYRRDEAGTCPGSKCEKNVPVPSTAVAILSTARTVKLPEAVVQRLEAQIGRNHPRGRARGESSVTAVPGRQPRQTTAVTLLRLIITVTSRRSQIHQVIISNLRPALGVISLAFRQVMFTSWFYQGVFFSDNTLWPVAPVV